MDDGCIHRAECRVGKTAGFLVLVYFVGIDDPQTNIERVALRVKEGGHDVPLDRIVPRWKRSMNLAADAILSSDRAFVFDNSLTEVNGSALRMVLRWNVDKENNLRTWAETPPTPDWVTKYISTRLKAEFRKDEGLSGSDV